MKGVPMSLRSWALLFVSFVALAGQPAFGQPALAALAWTSLASLERRNEEPWLLRHLPPDTAGWSVTETRNFRIRHSNTPALAEKVARAAEHARSAAFFRWFAETGTVWQPRCEIYLYPSGTAFRRATGLPEAVPASSTTLGEAGRVFSRRIDLYRSAEHLLDAIIPHEVTHIVLADHFGTRLPPWANEGIAVQEEPSHRVRLHLRSLPTYREQNRLYRVETLLRLNGYPGTSQMGPFYAQSVSLVEFLAKQRDPRVLVEFLRDGSSQGYEKALRRHYNMDFKELNRRWFGYAFAEQTVSTLAQRR